MVAGDPSSSFFFGVSWHIDHPGFTLMALGDVQGLMRRVFLTAAPWFAAGALHKDEGPSNDARPPGDLSREFIALLKQEPNHLLI